jgi:GNAT superfamily N-acetyltransferase
MIKIENQLPLDAPENSRSIQALWFVQYEGGAWAGFGGLQFHRAFPYLGPTFVRPEFRGRGIQKGLVAARVQWLRDQKYTRAITIVDDHNVYSIRNVTGSGFVEVGRDGGEIHYQLDLTVM